MDLRQFHTEDTFEGQSQMSRSPGTKTAFLGPFGGLRAVYGW